MLDQIQHIFAAEPKAESLKGQYCARFYNFPIQAAIVSTASKMSVLSTLLASISNIRTKENNLTCVFLKYTLALSSSLTVHKYGTYSTNGSQVWSSCGQDVQPRGIS